MKKHSLILLVILFSCICLQALMVQKYIQSHANIKTIGIEAYWEHECLNKVERIDWGMLEPNSTNMRIIYLRNEGNYLITLTLNSSDWTPSEAKQYFALSWNYTNTPLSPNEVQAITLNLRVANIVGITKVEFLIIITVVS